MDDYYKIFYYWMEEYIPWGILAVDRDFRIIFWNKWLEINTNLKKEFIFNKNIFEVIPYTQKFKRYFEQVLEGSSIVLAQRFHKYMIPIEIGDQNLKYMQQTVQLFPLIENNEIKGVIATIEDVTERIKREEEYKKQIRSLKILNEVQKSIFSLDFNECIEKLFEGISKITNAPVISIFLMEDGSLRLVKSTKDIGIYYESIDDPLCVIQETLKQRKTIYIPNTKESAVKCIDPSAISVLSIPLLGKEKTFGVVVIESYNKDAFEKEEILNLETIVMQGSILLENSKLLNSLRESEDRYRMLAEQSLVGVFLIQDEKVQYVNPRFAEIFGYPSHIETFDDLLKYISEEDKQNFLNRYNTVLERSLDYIIDEFRAKKSNGEDIYIEISMVGIMYKSKPAVLGTILDITYRKKLEEELKVLSITDALTELYNRRGFITLAEHTVSLAKRLSKKIFVLFIDLDYMKWINDNLGHNVGDQALIDVANILRNTFRQNDLIARFGGDEFVVLGICGEENHKEKIVERLIKNVERFNNEKERPYRISLSVGSLVYDPQESLSLEDILEKADKLMYEDKKRKKSTRDTR